MLAMRVVKRFGAFRLDVDVTFDAASTCVFGPSGCGKSTLVRMAAGLADPDEGVIRWGAETLFDRSTRINVPARLRGIAYVPQDVLLFPHMDVRANLLYGYERTPSARRSVSPEAAIELLDIGDLLEKKTDQLSGGQAQRVAIGRALLSCPRLLIMDEPLSSLDRQLKERILPYLREIRDRFDVRLLYVTHAIDEIFAVAEKVLLLKAGSAIGYGAPDVVFDEPRTFAAIADEGYSNALVGRAVPSERDGHPVIDCGGFLIDPGPGHVLSLGAQVRAHIHARNILLSASMPVGLSAQNVLAGTVARVAETGGEYLVHIDAGQEIVAEVTPHALETLGLSPGVAVFWIVKSHAIHVDAAV